MSRATPRRAVEAALAFAFVIACGVPLAGGALAQPRGAADRGARADEVAARLAELRSRIRPRPGGVLGLMGYNVTPDGSTNAVQVDRSVQAGGDEGDPTLTLASSAPASP